jgi:hypothetical protein
MGGPVYAVESPLHSARAADDGQTKARTCRTGMNRADKLYIRSTGERNQDASANPEVKEDARTARPSENGTNMDIQRAMRLIGYNALVMR